MNPVSPVRNQPNLLLEKIIFTEFSERVSNGMKRLAFIAILLTALLTSTPAYAHESETPHEETNVNAAIPNDNVNAEQKRANFRSPAALKPLLLVPIAIGLYFIYERLARRN